jgi:hypothetical protein
MSVSLKIVIVQGGVFLQLVSMVKGIRMRLTSIVGVKLVQLIVRSMESAGKTVIAHLAAVVKIVATIPLCAPITIL